MKVKLEWLNELVDISDINEEDLIKALSLYSIEVEGNHKVLSGTNLVVGHVLSAERIKDSDHLSACRVDVGSEVLPIVCGAPNVRAGQYVIVAKEGAELPGELKIKRAKIRGEESQGMICSLEELGLEKKYVPEEYQNGIYYFKDEVEVGSDPLKALNLADTVIELGVTQPRPAQHARRRDRISAVDRPFRMPAYNVNYIKEECADYVTVKARRPAASVITRSLWDRDQAVAMVAISAHRFRDQTDKQRRRHHQLHSRLVRQPCTLGMTNLASRSQSERPSR